MTDRAGRQKGGIEHTYRHLYAWNSRLEMADDAGQGGKREAKEGEAAERKGQATLAFLRFRSFERSHATRSL